MESNIITKGTLPELPNVKKELPQTAISRNQIELHTSNDKSQKLLKFFPQTQVKSINLKEFLLSNPNKSHSWGDPLDPDKIGFKQPDFGFNAELDFDADY